MVTWQDSGKQIVAGLRRVFRQPTYVALAMLVGFGLLFGYVCSRQWPVVQLVLSSSTITLYEKLQFVGVMLRSMGGNTETIAIILTWLLSILFGVQMALLVFYVRNRRSRQWTTTGSTASLASIGGVVAGLFGIGCAACGSVLATALLGTVGASGLLVWLPLDGLEFVVIGTLLLTISICYLAKHINDPLVCR